MRPVTYLLTSLVVVGLLSASYGSRADVDYVLAQSTQPRLVVFESFNSPG